MKWKNKGKEFEVLGKRFHDFSENIYIYGAGEYGAELLERLEPVKEKVIFIDSNTKKQRAGYCAQKVISPENITEELVEHSILIIAASIVNTTIIEKNLIKKGIIQNGNIFTYREFVECYLPIYLYYTTGKLYIQDITILITEKCTLRCEKCAPMYSYLHNPRHRDLEEIKSDIDSLFQKVDYVWDLIFTGGEPFLHPHFLEIMQYVEVKYKECYGHIQIISNGTVIPKEELLRFMSQKNLYVSFSDYTKFIDNKKIMELFEQNIEKCKEYGVQYEINQADSWVDFGFAENKDKKEKDTRKMSDFFDACNSSCRAFHKGKFVYCVPAFYSDIVMNQKTESQCDSDNFYSGNIPVEILEWTFGFSENGYLDMCRICNGYITINQNHIVPAIQRRTDNES